MVSIHVARRNSGELSGSLGVVTRGNSTIFRRLGDFHQLREIMAYASRVIDELVFPVGNRYLLTGPDVGGIVALGDLITDGNIWHTRFARPLAAINWRR